MKPPLQTPFLNPDPFQQWYGIENVAKMKINELHSPHSQWCTGEYHHAEVCK